MKRATIKLMIAFIEQVVGIILYQGNIFPKQHCVDLYEASSKLIKALERE